MSDLLPCPFCGGEAVCYDLTGVETVICDKCGARISDEGQEWTGKRAWNSRVERTCHNTHENRWFKCSACGYGFTDLYADDEHDIDEQPKYCPNCGAKVVGE